MRRLVALVLAHALAVSSAMAWSAHVHAYAGHDHPEHHHGVASHSHSEVHHGDLQAEGHDDAAPRPEVAAESCDPGRHAVSVTLLCTDVQHVHLDHAEVVEPADLKPTRALRRTVRTTDIRVHGPPASPGLPARAPPLSSPA